MELLSNTEVVLDRWVNEYGLWVYLILFIIIFCETGLVVTPFLPGDSLLFLAGTIAHRANNDLNVISLLLILSVAAVLGDAMNYTIGRFFGKKLFSNPNSKIFKQVYLEKTNKFYEKHGGKTIILARFVPIVRTFAPFVAGMGKMTYRHFFSFNVVGGISWISLFTLLGYFVGTFDFVQNNIKFVVVLIIIISILPGVFEVIRNKRKK
ncbi:MAG: DedA family protein [Dysgonomonas sp.]